MIIGGKAQVVKRKPTQSELQNAYDKYNKRFGSYAATKQENKNENSGFIKVIRE